MGPAIAAARAAAPGAALPHADPLVLAPRLSIQPLHQLAAGSAEQLPGAAGLPGESARVRAAGGPGRRDGGLQSLRLLPRARRRAPAVFVRGLADARAV